MTKTRTRVTKAAAKRVLAAVKEQCKAAIFPGDKGPELRENFAWSGSPARWAVVWEEGPFEWTYLFPHGGIEEEFGFRRADVSGRIPDGVFCEAMTSWALGIYDA